MSTPTVAANGAAPDSDTRKWLGLVVLSLALALIIIDASIVNVTLPSIQQEFAGTSVASLQWISAAYSLTFAALLITFGRLSDALGRRLIFMIGVGIFVVGSVLVGAGQSVGMIIAGRIVQGIGGAMASPSTLSILTTTFTGRARNIAFGVWGATSGAAGALGPILGGWLTTSYSWRWAFLVNVPVGIIAIVGSLILLNESFGQRVKHFDIPGVLLISIGLAALVFGTIEGPSYGWWQASASFDFGVFQWPASGIAVSAVSFAVAVVLLGFFGWYETNLAKRGGTPIFNFGLLKYRSYRYGLMTVGVVALGEFGILLVLSLYLQLTRGLSALDTGLTLLPFPIGAFIMAPIGGVLSARFGPKWIVTIGMLLEAIAIFLIGRIITKDVDLHLFIPVFLLYGVGLGLAIAQLTGVVLSDVPPQETGAASGANNTIRQVGAAIGIAILGAILASQISTSGKAELAKSTVIPPPLKVKIAQALDKGLDPSSGAGSVPGAGQGPIGAAILDVFAVGVTDGTQAASLAASGFVFLGAVSSLFIPNPAHGEPTVITEGPPAARREEAAGTHR